MRNHLMGGLAISIIIAFSGSAYAQGARDAAPAGEPRAQGGATGQAPTSPSTGQAPGLRERESVPQGQGKPSERAQERTGMDGATTKPGETKSGDTPSKPGGTKPGDTTTKPGDTNTKPGDTTGKPGGGASGDLPKVDLKPEQQTQIRQRITNVNIRTISETQLNVTSISIGVVIPRTIELVPIPAEIVEIVPQFRGYRIIRVGARYLIVHPESYRIVYIITV